MGPFAADVSKPIVAMIHLPPLPGSANYGRESMREIVKRAVDEARLLASAGFDAIMLQNTNDRPSTIAVTRVTLAAMTAVACSVREVYPGVLGINVHKNDAEGALAVAAACEASFVRIKVLVGAVVGPEGVIQGAAETTIRVRGELPSPLEVWADLNELTSWPVASIPMPALADLAARFGLADRLIVTAPTVKESLEFISAARLATTVPILLGGRTTPATIGAALASSDGVIVGACLRRNGKTTERLEEAAVKAFMLAARASGLRERAPTATRSPSHS